MDMLESYEFEIAHLWGCETRCDDGHRCNRVFGINRIFRTAKVLPYRQFLFGFQSDMMGFDTRLKFY